MYNVEDLTYYTQGGEIRYANQKELDRIMKENAKAAQSINPARNAWAYWAKVSSKQAKKGAN